MSVKGELDMLQDVTSLSFRLSPEWVSAMRALELNFEGRIYNLLFQRVVDLFFTIIMQECAANTEIKPVKPLDSLSLSEKQVLHYAAGYIS